MKYGFKLTRPFTFALILLAISGSPGLVFGQTTDIISAYAASVTPKPYVRCVNLTYDLYLGLRDRGIDDSVLRLQRFLSSSGYLSALPNGYFGSGTLSAVRQFQFAKGIPVTGRVGPQTRAKIKEITCFNSLPAESQIQASPSPRSMQSTYSSDTDQFSGIFTTLVKPVSIGTVLPAIVSNDSTEFVLLYGSGFEPSSIVHFDSDSDGTLLVPSYVSPDGRILVFSVPPSIPAGRHSLSVKTRFSSSSSAESNWADLEVKDSQ